MLDLEKTTEVSTCSQHRRRVHGKHGDRVFVNLTRRIAFLVGIVVDQQSMVWILGQPLRSNLGSREDGVNIEPLVCVFATVHASGEARSTAALRIFKGQRRVGILHEVVAVCTAQSSQTVDANCRVGGVVFAVTQVRITLCSRCTAEGGGCYA